LKGLPVAAVLAASMAGAVAVVLDSPAIQGIDRESTIAMAPLVFGNPAAAATLKTRLPGRPRAPRSPSAPFQYTLKAGAGDTLAGMLTEAGIPGELAHAASAALSKRFNPRRIRPGQEIIIRFEPTEGAGGRFTGLSVSPRFDRRITVTRLSGGGFEAAEEKVDLKRTLVRHEGKISRSLFLDGEKAGIPAPVLARMIRAFSWDVDFQRDIRPGDAFQVMHERFFDNTGEAVNDGKILFASLTLGKVRYPIYLHTLKDGGADFFNEKGESAKKALMRTPIDGARLSSGFGKRRHPILGYTKMHRGVDFAAPRGTSIYAAGSGLVETAGRNGAYGNYVRIRHNARYATAYAHMSRLATRRGRRVRQGQVIGYVGTSGRSTGPHLHYEILIGGRQTNPMKVKMPSGRQLKGAELARFQSIRAGLDRAFAALKPNERLAKAE
jgi:murein DD-endopeptidase MepM/ murein hydrolase activator NlpD